MNTEQRAEISPRLREYVSVSQGFAHQLGFEPEELIGRRVEETTAPNTADVDFAFRVLDELGELDGLWMLKHRMGLKVLVHYHAWTEPSKVLLECETVMIAP